MPWALFVNFNGKLVLLLVFSFALALTEDDLPDAGPCVPPAPALARVRVTGRVCRGVRGRLQGRLDNLLDDAELDGGQRLGVRVGGGQDGLILGGARVERGQRGARVVDL